MWTGAKASDYDEVAEGPMSEDVSDLADEAKAKGNDKPVIYFGE